LMAKHVPGNQIAAALRNHGVCVTDWQVSNIGPTRTLLDISEVAPEHDELVVVDLCTGDRATVNPCGTKKFQWVPETRRIIAGHPAGSKSRAGRRRL
jgi:hypothetical protein